MRLCLLAAAISLVACAGSRGATSPTAPATAADAATSEAPVASALDPVRSVELIDRARILFDEEDDAAGALAIYRDAFPRGALFTEWSHYRASRAAARMGQPEEAVVWLTRAFEAGLDDIPYLEKERDLDGLRQHPAYVAALRRLEEKIRNQDGAYRDELLRMAREDQALRTFDSSKDDENTKKLRWARIHELDARNTARFKELVVEKGWPTFTMVGKDAANSGWLLVQHGALTPGFQEEMLVLMEKALADGEADLERFALLTDRVLVFQGKAQRYGTQPVVKDGLLRPIELEDPANVDLRRAKIGMTPMEPYLRSLAASMGVSFSMDPAPPQKL